MSRNYLAPIFNAIYNIRFDKENFKNRLLMQKAIYLLEDLGVTIGDYPFSWYKRGPYSQALQNDILAIDSASADMSDITFAPYAQSCIDALKNIVSQRPDEYELSTWLECVASMRYLITYTFIVSVDFDTVNAELKIRKPHLNNDTANHTAFELICQMFSE